MGSRLNFIFRCLFLIWLENIFGFSLFGLFKFSFGILLRFRLFILFFVLTFIPFFVFVVSSYFYPFHFTFMQKFKVIKDFYLIVECGAFYPSPSTFLPLFRNEYPLLHLLLLLLLLSLHYPYKSTYMKNNQIKGKNDHMYPFPN